jgi:hypothetical protein
MREGLLEAEDVGRVDPGRRQEDLAECRERELGLLDRRPLEHLRAEEPAEHLEVGLPQLELMAADKGADE